MSHQNRINLDTPFLPLGDTIEHEKCKGNAEHNNKPCLESNIYNEENFGSKVITTKQKDLCFPRKLHLILSNPNLKHIITWLSHGRSWRVLDPKAFEREVIPLFFRHKCFASFMRQVNAWGFRRVNQGLGRKSYYHKFFIKDLPQLCAKMTRHTSANSCNTTRTRSSSESDFYEIGRQFPLPQQDIHVTSCMQQNGLQSKFDRYTSLMNQIKVSAVQNQSSNYIDALRQRQMLLAQGLCASNSINGLENNLATAASNVSTLEPTSQLQFIDMQTYDILNRRYPLFAYGNYHVSDVVMGQSSQVLSQFTQQNHDMQLDV